jgi:bifunctional enzyme CysN/CysC
MSHQSDLIQKDILAYLAQHERKDLLRFLTCGNVDDGKSTLIGRLLHDSKLIYEDQLAAVKADSARYSTTGDVDLALLVDGLQAEREQGITIDVAYRYFSTSRRKFIIADTPGHEQYTRNMATGASTCDLAVILVDARHGVQTQTRRHSFIVSLLGIRHVVVAVNKMDLVGYSEEVFERIRLDYEDFAGPLAIPDVHFIPISALKGDNIVHVSKDMPWYDGPTLMHHLEHVPVAGDRNLDDFRLPVQFVNRPHADFRGFCGTIASGVVRPGDEIVVLPSRKANRVKSIVGFEGELAEAFAGQAVTLTLEKEVDVSRGDLLAHPGNLPHVDEGFEAMIVWMTEQPLRPGQPYWIKIGTRLAGGAIGQIRRRVNVNTLQREPASELHLNEIAHCAVDLTQPVVFDAYRKNRSTGSFVVIDRLTNNTVGAGMILEDDSAEVTAGWELDDALERHRARSIAKVSRREKEGLLGQKALGILLTGLVGSGKQAVAYALEKKLHDLGRAVQVVDAPLLEIDPDFSPHDRVEQLRRAGRVAKLLNEAGVIAILPFIVSTSVERERLRTSLGEDRFIEVHLAAPVEACRLKDPAGLYALADAGRLAHLPGVSAPYEPPAKPDLAIPSHEISAAAAADQVVGLLARRGLVR